MAQTPTTPKIEELRFKLKTDPKSRHFYPLAEELRKIGQHEEAEKILLEGLEKHPGYLSAWIGLGRVLKDASRQREAIESFQKGLVIDPGNLVAARQIAECYLALGEKVEAIKKFKLVNALMPGDEEIEAHIEALELELHRPEAAVAPEATPSAPSDDQPVEEPPVEEFPIEDPLVEDPPAVEEPPVEEPLPEPQEREQQFVESAPPLDENSQSDVAQSGELSPFESLGAPGSEENRFESEESEEQPWSLESDASAPESDADPLADADEGLAMTREAGVSPADEDIFASASDAGDSAMSTPSTGGGLAYEDASSGLSVLETHSDAEPDDEMEDGSDVFAASLEVPAPPLDEEISESDAPAPGPWIDDEPRHDSAPQSFVAAESAAPSGRDLSDTFRSHSAASGAPQSASSMTSPNPLVTAASDPSVRNDAAIQKLRNWESRIVRGGK